MAVPKAGGPHKPLRARSRVRTLDTDADIRAGAAALKKLCPGLARACARRRSAIAPSSCRVFRAGAGRRRPATIGRQCTRDLGAHGGARRSVRTRSAVGAGRSKRCVPRGFPAARSKRCAAIAEAILDGRLSPRCGHFGRRVAGGVARGVRHRSMDGRHLRDVLPWPRGRVCIGRSCTATGGAAGAQSRGSAERAGASRDLRTVAAVAWGGGQTALGVPRFPRTAALIVIQPAYSSV